MHYGSIDSRIRELYDYAVQNGFTEDLFFQADNLGSYIRTAIDGYSEYPLFLYTLGGRYDAHTLARMMTVDFKCRLRTVAGIASSADYESVLMIEPPGMKRTGMLQYVRSADLPSWTLIFRPAIYRQMIFERYALDKRRAFLDEKTWYMYIFSTRKKNQNRGYGKKLMKLILSYADRKGYRVCLETNQAENIAMYEHFGFRTVNTSRYRNRLEHFVMLYGD